ncbi:MAG: M24 family metallopeptidase [Candidatus Bathyarchaeia archaeon]|nr:aminopeptidase P family protein [Candidatus Bathyarchaeota archaeon]
MLNDLEIEMEERGLEAIVVSGGDFSRELYYLVRVVIPRGGIYFKRIRGEPEIIVSNVDVLRAEEGIVRNIRTFTEYGYEELVRKHGSSAAMIQLYDKMFRRHGVEGNIGFYGIGDVGEAHRILKGLENLGYRVVGEARPNLLDRLMETKDPLEISEIKRVGLLVEKIMEETITMISDNLGRGRTVTVGDAKRYARTLMAEAGLRLTEDLILSSGERTADPHYLGVESEVIKRDTPVILDFYPQGDNMLYFDFTRTIIVGKASKRLKHMYEDVLYAQDMAYDLLNRGNNTRLRDVVGEVCEFFEGKGYPTVRRLLAGDAALKRGFIHSLGHGVGWSLSDLPRVSLISDDKLRRGQVFTLEPGLYEPGLGGIRIEDVYVSDGERINRISRMDRTLER